MNIRKDLDGLHKISVQNFRALGGLKGNISYVSPERPLRSLGGRSLFLNGVLITLDLMIDLDRLQRSPVQNFRSLGGVEAPNSYND